MTAIALRVNGEERAQEIDPRTLLVQFIRDHLRLTGTHVGCDTTQCGACVVHLDGRPVKSCTVLAASASGGEVTTIEGLAKGRDAHAMQQAFRDHHALQCGFCTSGMIMTGVSLVARYGRDLTEETVRAGLEGNICRCTGYQTIVDAILDAAHGGER